MAQVFIEILSEEIPARMQVRGGEAFLHLLLKGFQDKGIEGLEGKFYTAPRRLVITLANVPCQGLDRLEERRGPRVDGTPDALAGFLKSQGITKEDLEIKKTPKGEFYFLNQLTKGLTLEEMLPPLIKKSIKSIPWPASMTWGWGTTSWVRPLKGIICLVDDKPLAFTLYFGEEGQGAGITAGQVTQGHRFLSHGLLTIPSEKAYWQIMEKAFVLVDHQRRKSRIYEEAKILAAQKGLTVIEDADLLDEVTGLAEWPVVMMGSIDPQFMSLPPEVLMTAMRVHQRYFGLHDKDDKLAPYFIFVANIKGSDGGKQVVKGNERVLKARLSDALFFYQQDCKVGLNTYAKQLQKITFHRDLGTVADKTLRLQQLSGWLAQRWGGSKEEAYQGASLLKADLLSSMVGEFPELQGVMGSYYARHEGYSDKVSLAIREHYLPKLNSDPCPVSFLGKVMAVADRVDSLVGFFGMGIQPTSSKDPFALRRSMLGLIRLLENGLSLAMQESFEKAYDLYQGCLHKTRDQTLEDLNLFLRDRLKIYWQSQGFRLDAIMAVLSFSFKSPLAVTKKRLEALQHLSTQPQASRFVSLYKRAANILGETALSSPVTAEALETEVEKDLFIHLQRVEKELDNHLARQDFFQALKQLETLAPYLSLFFEKVLVNDPNPTYRQNRLALMQKVKNLFERVGDFSQIEIVSSSQKDDLKCM